MSGWLVWLYSQSPHWLQIPLWLPSFDLAAFIIICNTFIVTCNSMMCVVCLVCTAGDDVSSCLGEAEPVEETQETQTAQPGKEHC